LGELFQKLPQGFYISKRGDDEMGRHTIFVTITLAFVWCILMEGFSWQNAAIGLFVSMLSLHFVGKFFRFEEIQSVAWRKLVGYPFWLVARIYVDAFFLMKLILSDAKWGIMTHELELENESLRTMLADSITLTPGSVYLEREGKTIELLCIGSRKKEGYPASVDDLRSIEKMLMKSQKG
jgi:multisubunit Na+/H+ antiporter MnhE subunit